MIESFNEFENKTVKDHFGIDIKGFVNYQAEGYEQMTYKFIWPLWEICVFYTLGLSERKLDQSLVFIATEITIRCLQIRQNAYYMNSVHTRQINSLFRFSCIRGRV